MRSPGRVRYTDSMRTGRTVLLLAVVSKVVAATALSCGAPPSGGGSADAGPTPWAGSDGGGADGGASDAGRDGGPDAGEEVPDAGPQLLGWANLQWPPWATVAPGAQLAVYGQVWMDGVTSQPGKAPGVVAEAGVGPTGSVPWGPGWTWTPATFNVDVGNNDEFVAQLAAPSPGLHDFAFRYRFEAGPWLYADRSDRGRQGTDDGYQADHAGRLSVPVAGARLRVVTLNLHCLQDQPVDRLDAAAARLTALGVDLVALQEVCVDPAAGAPLANSAAYLAQRLSAHGRPFSHDFAQTHLFQDTFPEGVGVVSGLPLAHAEVLDLPVADFPRKAQVVVVATPLGMAAIASTHLSFRQQDAQARLAQAEAVLQGLAALSPAPALTVIAGDFNTVPGTPPVEAVTTAGYTDAWAAAHPGQNGFTHRSDNPTRRIDYLFFRSAAGAPAPVQAASVALEFASPYTPGQWVSDHIAVSAELAVP
jgi:endonuclease/exonuclease/phosphatase family metal-dependent hydrolase